MRPLGSPQKLEKRRIKAILLLKKKIGPVKVARRLGVEYRSVYRWNIAYKKGGKEMLKAKTSSGRPSKLTIKNKLKIENILLKGARSVGYSTDLWTCSRIADVIYRKFKIRYHSAHISKILHTMRWSQKKSNWHPKEYNQKVRMN